MNLLCEHLMLTYKCYINIIPVRNSVVVFYVPYYFSTYDLGMFTRGKLESICASQLVSRSLSLLHSPLYLPACWLIRMHPFAKRKQHLHHPDLSHVGKLGY